MVDPAPICGSCDCSGLVLLGFLVGIIFGVLINIVLDEGERRKELKKKKFDPPE